MSETPTLSRQYVKLCDPRDFEDPALLEMLRSILPERDPRTHIERKAWEFAMLALFLSEVGLLTDDARALSVGAGDERILFWLANRVGQIVACDIYGQGRFAAAEAAPSMLDDPAAHAPFPYRTDRLEARFMDARELAFPAGTFDFVFSLSSLEHIGTRADVARSARELGRVLAPGGYAVIATECLVRHHPLDAVAGAARTLGTLARPVRERGTWRRGLLTEMFTPAELQRQIVAPSGLELVQPLDLGLSRTAWELVLPADPGSWPAGTKPFGMVLLRAARSVFTSVCLVMRKAPAP